MNATTFSELFDGKRALLAEWIDVAEGSALWTVLRDRGILNKSHIENCTTLRTTNERISKLLELLERRPGSMIPGFFEALRLSDQQPAIDILNNRNPHYNMPQVNAGAGNVRTNSGAPGFSTSNPTGPHSAVNAGAGNIRTNYGAPGFSTSHPTGPHSAAIPGPAETGSVRMNSGASGFNAPLSMVAPGSVGPGSVHFSASGFNTPNSTSNNTNNATTRVQGDNSSSTSEVTPVRYGDLHNLEHLAEGGFGVVYRAAHINWGLVAYKELKLSVEPPAKISRELRSEAAAFNLRHPNIVSLLGVVYEPGHYGVVFEYIKWKGLDDFIESFTVGWPMKLSIAYGIAVGMNYLHTRNPPVVHGDLKIQNVLVGDAYVPKICDFGLTKWSNFSTRKTQSQTRRGTVTNIPPEYWMNINLPRTPKYDIYGFGILMWELMTENMPFQHAAGDHGQIKQAVIDNQRPDVEALEGPDDVVSTMRDCIERCWHQDPNNRPSFADIESCLRTLLVQHAQDHLTAKAALDAETAGQA